MHMHAADVMFFLLFKDFGEMIQSSKYKLISQCVTSLQICYTYAFLALTSAAVHSERALYYLRVIRDLAANLRKVI